VPVARGRPYPIIRAAFNQVELLRTPRRTPEMLALTQAEEAVGDWAARLHPLCDEGAIPMCAGAVVHTRLERVVFGASDRSAARRAAR